jgi:hypothetical protein
VPLEDDDVFIELRQVFDPEDFPADVQAEILQLP